MKPALQLKLSQHLALTPQLHQSIKLLQLSTIEMQQEIERYLLENPMLEREDDTPESFAGAQQLPGADPQFAEQGFKLRGVQRGFQIAHDVGRQATGL